MGPSSQPTANRAVPCDLARPAPPSRPSCIYSHDYSPRPPHTPPPPPTPTPTPSPPHPHEKKGETQQQPTPGAILAQQAQFISSVQAQPAMATSRVDVEKGGSSPRKQEKGKVPAPLYPQHEGEREWTPWLVPSILVANITVFVIAMYYNNCPSHNARPGRDGQCVARFLGRFAFQPLRQNPLLGPSSAALVKMGALVWDKVVHGHQGWRLFSCMWMHAGVLHLLANMLSLLFIGLRLEQQFGYVRIGAIYLISGVGGSVLSSLFVRSAVSVGASGALFGLLGAMLAELLSNWTIYSNKVAAVTTLLFVVAVNLVLGILPHVNNFAHIGGFLTGFLLGFVLLMRPHFGWMERYRLPAGSPCTSRKYLPYQWALMAVALALAVAGFAIGLALVFRGANANSSCSWCHYLSCVPTASWTCAN